jgi:MFS family permease
MSAQGDRRPSVTGAILRLLGRMLRALGRMARGRVVVWVGGPARARVIVLFGGVLALSGADASTVGAAAPQLEHALHINNTQVGLLASVALLVGAVFVIPVGFLVDRVKRIPLLAGSIVLWSVASLASAFAGSYGSLLITRLLLGAVTATAGPAIASLTGDYFPARERGRVYAYILGGEVAGTAIGFIVSGTAAGITWRAPFILLAIPGFFLARELFRTVPEPVRGGQTWLEPGMTSVQEAFQAAKSQPESEWDWEDTGSQGGDLAQEQARERGIEPDPKLVLEEDPQRLGVVQSIRYILSIPTNVLMIISSSLGYFFFSGLSTFAILFVRGHYNVGQFKAEEVLVLLVAGSLIGTLVSGRVTDALLRRGVLEIRVWAPAVCYLGAAVLLLPAFLATSLTLVIYACAILGAGLLAAANPPLDAARLDIMPSGLWGRAESTRTFLRSLAQALAPLAFGGISQLVAGIVPKQTPVGTHPQHGAISHASALGLEVAFSVLLVTLVAAGVFLWMARKTYPRDVATAGAASQGRRPKPMPAGGGPAQAEGAG